MEKEIRRHFSKIGFAYLAGSIVIYAIQFLAAMVGKKFVPGVMADANSSFIVLMLTMYGISMPFMGWLVSKNSGPEDRRKENDRRTVDHSISHVLRSDVRRKPDRDGADLWDRNGKRNRR